MSRDLPIPAFTGEQHHLAFAALRSRPPSQQQIEFFFPPDKISQACRVQSLEPAFYGSRSECGPGSHRTSDPFEVLCAEVLELEQVAHEPPCALSYDNAGRLSNALQAGCEVRRLAYDSLLLRSAGPD